MGTGLQPAASRTDSLASVPRVEYGNIFFPFLPHISPAWEKNRIIIKKKIEKDLPTPTEDKKSQMENPQAKNEILRKYHFRFRPVSVSQVDSTIRLVWEQQHSDWGGVGPSQGSCLWWMGYSLGMRSPGAPRPLYPVGFSENGPLDVAIGCN